jgi:hypothetical protein
MKHLLKIVGLCVLASGLVTVASAQVVTPQTPPPPPAEVTFEGCLAQGNTPDVFILQNAKAIGGAATESNLRLVVTPKDATIALKQHLTHLVQVTGVRVAAPTPTATPTPTPTAGQPVPDSALPKITASKITMMSNECVMF